MEMTRVDIEKIIVETLLSIVEECFIVNHETGKSLSREDVMLAALRRLAKAR